MESGIVKKLREDVNYLDMEEETNLLSSVEVRSRRDAHIKICELEYAAKLDVK